MFEGQTAGLLKISCQVSVIEKGHSPHDLHNHDEEEILFILSGSARLILSESNDLVKNENMDLREGQFVYLPAHFFHTIKTTSDMPSHCLTLKWKSSSKIKNSVLNFACFSIPDNKDDNENNKFLSKTLFEGQTLYLDKLHCHASVMNPGSGVNTHRDIYDVVTIMLEGEAETLDKKATPYDVIFYAAGKPHSIYNRGNNIAREVVFEFHTNKASLIMKNPYLLNYYFQKLIELQFWKRKLKKILRF